MGLNTELSSGASGVHLLPLLQPLSYFLRSQFFSSLTQHPVSFHQKER